MRDDLWPPFELEFTIPLTETASNASGSVRSSVPDTATATQTLPPGTATVKANIFTTWMESKAGRMSPETTVAPTRDEIKVLIESELKG